MEFYRKYELIEPLPGEGTRVFRAKQAATGREVAVHLLVGGYTPENEALLARLRALPPASVAKLLEVGENEGTPYVVTVAPPYLHLEAWLRSRNGQGRHADPKKYSRAGMWKVPPAPPGARLRLAPQPAIQPSAPPVGRAARRVHAAVSIAWGAAARGGESPQPNRRRRFLPRLRQRPGERARLRSCSKRGDPRRPPGSRGPKCRRLARKRRRRPRQRERASSRGCSNRRERRRQPRR